MELSGGLNPEVKVNCWTKYVAPFEWKVSLFSTGFKRPIQPSTLRMPCADQLDRLLESGRIRPMCALCLSNRLEINKHQRPNLLNIRSRPTDRAGKLDLVFGVSTMEFAKFEKHLFGRLIPRWLECWFGFGVLIVSFENKEPVKERTRINFNPIRSACF